jgi:hypothetical protein
MQVHPSQALPRPGAAARARLGRWPRLPGHRMGRADISGSNPTRLRVARARPTVSRTCASHRQSGNRLRRSPGGRQLDTVTAAMICRGLVQEPLCGMISEIPLLSAGLLLEQILVGNHRDLWQ